MRADSARDRSAALALAAALAALAAAKATAGIDVAPWPRRLDGRYEAALAIALSVLVVAGLAREVLVRRGLRDRVAVQLVPSEQFDPSLEQVRSFAATLPRISSHGPLSALTRTARGVRVQIATSEDGLLTYTVHAPAGSTATLNAALSAYPDLEHRPATTDIAAGGGRLVVRAELRLARASWHPLADRGLSPDLLDGVASAIQSLHCRGGERATIALDLVAAGPHRAARLRRQMRRRAHRATSTTGGLLASTMPARAGGLVSAADRVERRFETSAAARKLDPSEALLEIQLLLRVNAHDRRRALHTIRGLLAALDALSAQNHLRATGARIPGVGFSGADLPWRRRRFDRRLVLGRFAPRRRSVVGASEIAGLLVPPTRHCSASNIARSVGLIPAPPTGLPQYTQPGEVIPLGRLREAGPVVGVEAGETFFAYMAGRSRYGKTETAIGQFVALALAGHGGLFVDPHADAIAEIKSYLTAHGVRERVVEIDASERSDHARQPAWNLFAAHGLGQAAAAARVDAFVDALATTLGWQEKNARALNLATQAAHALSQIAIAAPRALAPTIFQVPTLLSDPQWRTAAIAHAAPATREFFEARFDRLPDEAITAVTNLIDRIRAARPLAALLGQPISTYDARQALAKNWIVLACPGPGSTRDRLLANLLVYDVLHAAKARANIAPSARRPFWVFLDEVQTYDGPNLPALLEQSAKYGGRGFLFNQNPDRLTAATWNAVSTNRSHLLSTTVNAKAARMISNEWGTQPDPDVLTRLERYTYLASITHRGRVTKPFLVHGVPARELHADHHHPDRVGELEAAINATSARRPISDALQDVEAHELRLRTWLTEPGASVDGSRMRRAPTPQERKA